MPTRLSDYIKPSDRQKIAFRQIGKGKILFYGGARGGGKSWLAKASAIRTALRNSGIIILIVRETYTELNDVFLSTFQELFPPEIFQYKYLESKREAKFKNGSIIKFRACDSEAAARKIQGAEAQYLIVDEAPNFPVEIIKLLLGSVRRNDLIPDFIPTLMMTGNPGGRSDLWFKTHFVDVNYSMWEPEEIKQADRFVFVPAFVQDNPHIDQEEYIKNLLLQGENKRRAWLYGDWDVFEGQFFEEWNPEVHVVEPFRIPLDWTRSAGFDLGWTEKHPSVGLWVAQNPDTGELYVYEEYVNFGVTEQYIIDIADMIPPEEMCVIFGDPSMFDRSKKNKYSDEAPGDMFVKAGIPLVPANNDRINGWRMLKQWLHWLPTRPPKLKIFSNCEYLIRTLPTLRYNKSYKTDVRREDLDTNMADDAADALRYAIISVFGYPDVSGITDIALPEQLRMMDEMHNVSRMEDYDEQEAFDKMIKSMKTSVRQSYYAIY